MTLASPVPQNLKPDLIRRIEAMPEEDLLLVHEVLLHAEKDRLWREVSADAEQERGAGRWENLPEVIANVRARLRQK